MSILRKESTTKTKRAGKWRIEDGQISFHYINFGHLKAKFGHHCIKKTTLWVYLHVLKINMVLIKI